MKFSAAFVTLLLSATASAGGLAKRSITIPRELMVRQSSSCPTGYKLCGVDACIETDYTCCPGGQGGCGPTEECQLGDNGEYGCCDAGESCSGDGGVTTSTFDDDDFGSTSTSDFFTSTSTSTRRATTTSSEDATTTTTTRSQTASASTTTSGSGGVSGGTIPGAAGFTYGSLPSALVLGGSAAAAVMVFVAAVAL